MTLKGRTRAVQVFSGGSPHADSGARLGFFIGGGKTEEPKAESGVGFLERGSNPFPPARESRGAL